MPLRPFQLLVCLHYNTSIPGSFLLLVAVLFSGFYELSSLTTVEAICTFFHVHSAKLHNVNTFISLLLHLLLPAVGDRHIAKFSSLHFIKPSVLPKKLKIVLKSDLYRFAVSHIYQRLSAYPHYIYISVLCPCFIIH